MKQPVVDRFQQQWPTRSPNRQLLSLLAAVIAREPGGKVELDIETVLDIEPGEAVVLALEGNSLVLRYSPAQTLIYAIQDTGVPWKNETPGSSLGSRSVMTDSQLADQEDLMAQRVATRQDLQEKAQAMRDGVSPLTGAVQFRKTARTSSQ